MTHRPAVFAIAVIASAAAFELVTYANQGEFELHLFRDALVGAIYGAFWVAALPFIARGGRIRAIALGAVSFPLVCVLTIVGALFVFYILLFWYIYLPIGTAVGYAAWRLSRPSPHRPTVA
jgi:hypothetical protein